MTEKVYYYQDDRGNTLYTPNADVAVSRATYYKTQAYEYIPNSTSGQV